MSKAKKKAKAKSATESPTLAGIAAANPVSTKATPIIVTLLKGSQVVCPKLGDVFLKGKPTVVKELSNWTRFQATVGLLAIDE